VTTQDLDADGTPDAIYTNQLDESLTVWWGRTDRTAGDRLDLAAGRSHLAPLAHDLDEDGVRDLLVPLPDDAAFVRLRGLGGRMFATAERIAQSPSPRETWAVDAREGPTVLFLAGTGIWARPIVHGNLGEARAVYDLGMTAPAALAMPGADLWLALLGSEPRLLRLDTDLVVREQRRPAGWPELVTLFAADLDGSRGQELYGVTPSGQAVRLPIGAADTPCAASPDGALQRASVLAHIDADGVPDAVQADSCPQCTSHHAVTFGQSAPP
jgi:hypothetical protein